MDKIITLPPYITPEHQRLLSDTEAQLADYSSWLASSLQPNEVPGMATKKRWRYKEIAEARESFLNDPIRLAVIQNLVLIKMLVEQPRLQVKKEENKNASI